MDALQGLLEVKSLPLLLVFVVVFLCFNFIRSVVELFWKIKSEKQAASDNAIIGLTAEVAKLRKDLMRYYSALKMLSGEKWADIRKEITEDEKII
jgi:rubrerythrin